jgi:hypothetical protein
MNRLSLPAMTFLIGMMGLAACEKAERPLSEREINKKIDSIVKARLPEILQLAAEDRDRRSSIEVKAKADSIVAATLSQKHK